MDTPEQEAKLAGDFIRATAPPDQKPESLDAEIAEVQKGILKEQPPADKPAEIEAEKPEDNPVDSEPELLELEKALAAMRRAGFNEKQIGRLAKRDVLERGIALGKMQSDFDALKRDHETLKKTPKTDEKPAAEAKTPATAPADISKLSEFLGEDAAPVVMQAIQAAVAPLLERIQEFEGRESGRIVGAARRELGVRYPQLQDETFYTSEITPLAEQLEATGRFTTAQEVLMAACRVLGLEEQKSSAEVATKTKERLNGIPETNGRKSPTVSKSREDLEVDGLEALERGDKQEANRLWALAKSV